MVQWQPKTYFLENDSEQNAERSNGHLFLESEDVGNTAIDRVPNTSQCLVRDGESSIGPGMNREVEQKL